MDVPAIAATIVAWIGGGIDKVQKQSLVGSEFSLKLGNILRAEILAKNKAKNAIFYKIENGGTHERHIDGKLVGHGLTGL